MSVNSVKVLRICTEINSELNQKQKQIVLIRLIEFAYSSGKALPNWSLNFLLPLLMFLISVTKNLKYRNHASHRKVNEIVDVRNIINQ
ncbi:MAG: hypothetical protein IPP29_06915 [Bacteroidetes bacterium]|nr:hypothetical protein [Bacteroidota bacterium]